ncbi:MAG: hypothetical protein PCFJNLEI_02573 [Verrucomicrobiae bacterium]|nr:hypothetical protein [Verrucomicrobiae bacterium]
MPITIEDQTANVWRLRVSGVLRKSEVEAVQASALKSFEQAGAFKMLILLDQFAGWASGEDWGDVSFYFFHGDKITKIAIVGDRKWETQILMFLGAGLRRAPVKFFPDGQAVQARIWLE